MDRHRSFTFLLPAVIAAWVLFTASVAFADSYTWTQQADSSATNGWWVICASADGTKLAAIASANNTGDIYTSTDSGATWTDRLSAGSQQWDGLTCSADGTHLAAAVAGGDIYTSTDSGATWT
jgi:hypothetical protein